MQDIESSFIESTRQMKDMVGDIVRYASIEEVGKVLVGQEHEIISSELVVEKVIDHVGWKRSTKGCRAPYCLLLFGREAGSRQRRLARWVVLS